MFYAFRKLSIEGVIEAKVTQILGVEWGEDVHVPFGDLENGKCIADLAVGDYQACKINK